MYCFQRVWLLALALLLLSLAACQKADTPRPTPPPGDMATLRAAAATPPAPDATAPAIAAATPAASLTPRPTSPPTAVPIATPAGPLADAIARQAVGDLDAAIATYRGLLSATPAAADAAAARYWLGEALADDGDTAGAIRELNAFVTDNPRHPLTPAALFSLGRLTFAAGQWDASADAYGRYVALNGPLADYAQNRVGNAHFSAGRYEQAATAYEAAVRRPDVTAPVLRAAWHGLGDTRARQQDWAGAKAAYEGALAAAPDDEDRAAALWALVQLSQAQGDTASARATLRRLWTDYPKTGPAYQAVTRDADGGDPALQYGRGVTAYQRGDNARAVDALNRAADDDPAHPADTHIYAAAAYRRLGQPQKAIFHYDQLIDTHPGDPLISDAQLGKARALRRDDSEAARAAYRAFLDKVPNHAEADVAALELAQTTEAAADCQTAIPLYQAAADRYATPAGWDARARLALCHMELGNTGAAAQAWQALAQASAPDRQAQGLYWLGELAASRDPARAADLYRQAAAAAPGEFYAARATQALNTRPARREGVDDTAAAEAWLLAKTGRTADDLTRAERAIRESPDIARARALYEQGLRESAARHLGLLRRRYQDDPLALYYLARAANDMGGYNAGMAAVETLATALSVPLEALPAAIQAQAFPRPYRALVEQAAARHGVDPALLYALMRQESRFEAGVTSAADARGLMQILPTTGQSIARSLGREGVAADDLFKPSVNIDLGAAFLAQQLRRFDGETWAALAAYNAGPNAVPRWREAAEDSARQIEAIDYPETATYVRKVLSYWAQYAALYG